jgi:hypothetical protein
MLAGIKSKAKLKKNLSGIANEYKTNIFTIKCIQSACNKHEKIIDTIASALQFDMEKNCNDT